MGICQTMNILKDKKKKKKKKEKEDDDHLQIENCWNVQCVIIIQISKELFCAFCWLNVKYLSRIHGMNNVNWIKPIIIGAS
jgi:hypothetical protein